MNATMKILHSVPLLLLLSTAALAADCDDILDVESRNSIHTLIHSSPVALIAMKNVRCTIAAQNRLLSEGACYKSRMWEDPDSKLWAWMRCLHPETDMHSYVYIGGEYVGDGFSLSPDKMSDDTLQGKLKAASAHIDPAKCGAAGKCNAKHLIKDDVLKKLETTIAKAPVVLYGWGGCPCTNQARTRFREGGVCYVETVWPDTNDPLFRYLQCVYGEENHSFVFIGGKFIGNGFVLGPNAMPQTEFKAKLKAADAATSCIKQGDKSLNHKLLRPCSQDNDGSTTGWTRSGSCNWDPTDGGYHEVCVTMSDKFLKASAKHDGNDLSSVVQAGGHWCICAWAFASAVTRDPDHLEGIELACDRTNEKLRDVYQHFIDMGEKLTAPSGVQYEAGIALKKVNEICEKRRRLRGDKRQLESTVSSDIWGASMGA